MIKIQKIDLQPYFDIAKRRIWWIIVPFVLCVFGGGIYILVTPKMYQSTTLILVESQRIPSSYVKSTITESLQNRLNTISQQVYSRTNLEKIIREFQLNKPREKGYFERLKDNIMAKFGFSNKAVNPDSMHLINFVRKCIKVSLKGGKRAFEISFEWYDPEIAAAVANALASQFIEQNLKIREEMAMGTTKFLESEVERLRREMERKGNELEIFKKKNMGMLPDELKSNITILNQLKDEYNSLANMLTIAKQQEATLQEQLKNEINQYKKSFSETDKFESISELEMRLKELKSIYTPKHPDVIALEKKIAKLKKVLKNQNNKNNSFKRTPLYYQLRNVKNQIKNYQERMESIRKQIDLYKHRIEITPKVALQLEKIQKEYNVLTKRYQTLLSKKLNAEMAEELEKRQKGEQFRVIDPAVPSLVPSSPNVKKVGFLVVILGIVSGIGFAFLRESLDPAFYTPEEIEVYLNTKVLVCLPFEENK